MKRTYNHSLWRSTLRWLGLPVLLLAGHVWAQDDDPGWPREIVAPGGARIIIYQPQVETFIGDDLTGRAAVSVTRAGASEPTFGAIWMTSRLSTDRDERTASVLDVTVTNVRFPDATPEDEQALASLLEDEIPKWEHTISLDRLLASLELAETQRIAADNLNNTPPEIIFVTYPAVLVSFDGEPQLRDVPNSNLTRAINTPFTIVFSPDTKSYYLYAGDKKWYTAGDVTGDWALTEEIPAQVAALAPPDSLEAEAESEADTVEVQEGAPPSIIVATVPTELIVSQGELEFTPINSIGLLYVSNTESDVLLEIESQQYFIVLSGRWFVSESLSGPWSYVASDALPATIAEIPPESEMGHLLVSVPGTEEAKEAVLDNEIPQTTAIDRTATLEVTYDGEPKFEPIEDTDMQYAVNTSSSVIKVEDKYYACEEAVWFVADDPTGPWVVADLVPQEIYTMPPSSPVYNVKYVYVYESTPEVVYVGYTPGYMGSYVYGGTIVYGTGFYYPGWYGAVYYPRPATWGFHVRYNPWYGWSFGFSYSTGPFTFAIGFGGGYRGGWWGPVGYRGYRYGYHRGWHHGYRAGARAGYRAGYRAANRPSHYKNIYNRPQNRSRNVARTTPNRQRPTTAPNRSNNVYADRSGNVHRRTQNGNWQNRSGKSWQSGNRASPSQNRSLERNYQSRQRGTTRTNNYNRSRSGGARRGGGRRR